MFAKCSTKGRKKSVQKQLITRLAACMMAAGLLANAPNAAAQLLGSSQITEYAMPTLAAGPCESFFDSNGIVWIEDITGNAITRFDPATQKFTNFPLATPAAIPGGMAIGPDGALWFPQVTTNQITRLDPSNGSMQSYPIPAGQILTSSTPLGIALASAIAPGVDGGMWFSMSGINAIGRIDVVTKQVTLFPLPTPLSSAVLATQIIKPGPGNTMVISLSAANVIATINVYTHEIKEYPLPTAAALPQGVTTDRNGIIWFTETAAQKFGTLDVTTGNITEYDMLALRGLNLGTILTAGDPLPLPGPIRQGSDGNIYIAEGGFEGGNKIAQYNPTTGAFKDFVTPTAVAGICDINNMKAGEIWFGEFTGNKLGKLTF